MNAPSVGLQPPPHPSHRGLDALMWPRSVAIVGASDDPTRIGGRPLAYLLRAGFEGTLLPINPGRQTVQGVPAFASLPALPTTPDLVIVAVAADAAVATVDACAELGVPATIIFSADFAESGAAGLARQRHIEATAARTGLCILGPNCLGVFNARQRLFATFSSVFEQQLIEGGNVGIVSQSGGFGGHLAAVARRRGVRIGQWLTTGNEAGVDVAACVEWMLGQDDIDIVMAYLEGVRDRDSLIRALARARASGKTVLIMKAGISQVGAEATLTHTAALAGADRVFDGVLAQFGVLRLPDAEAMVDTAYLLQRCPQLRGSRLGIVSISGAAGVQMADAAEQHGLTVPRLSDDAQHALRAINPFAAARNPVDITAQVFNDMSLVERNFDILREQSQFDAIVAYFGVVAESQALAPKLRAALTALARRHRESTLVLSLFACEQDVREYEDAGYAVFEDQARAVAAIGRAARARLAPARTASAELPAPNLLGWAHARELARQHDGTEASAKAIIGALGVAVPAHRLADDADQAVAAANSLGFPVALKVHGAGILHKSDIGGVELGLRDGAAVLSAARLIAERTRTMPGADGPARLLIEAMVPAGIECFIGLQVDAQLGAVVAIGFGGVQAELFRDVAIRLAPLTANDAREALASLRCAPLLEGYRGQRPADLDALIDCVVRLSAFFAANGDVVSAIEVNPLMVLPRGQGVTACDAVVIGR